MVGELFELRDWQPVVDDLSRVGKLVHLAARWDQIDQEGWRARILRISRRAYVDELEIQAARTGCEGRRGRLTNGQVLSAMSDVADHDSTSIVATYNYDLAHKIASIRSETPTANRHVYAFRLRKWMQERSGWKDPQVADYTDSAARARAQQDFARFNGYAGTARLQPRTAVCPICQGWIVRGTVSLSIAMANPPPYHPNCPHVWATKREKRSAEECELLWMGE